VRPRQNPTVGTRRTPSTIAGSRPLSGCVIRDVRRASTCRERSIQSNPTSSTGANFAAARSAQQRRALFVEFILRHDLPVAEGRARCSGAPDAKFHAPSRSGWPSCARGDRYVRPSGGHAARCHENEKEQSMHVLHADVDGSAAKCA